MLKNQQKSGGRKKAKQGRKSSGQPRRKGRKAPGGAPKEYKVAVAGALVRTTNRPRMQTMRNGDCRIVHREYVAELIGGTSNPSVYSANFLNLNPGLPETFPWLSKIAANYESYKFSKLKICYESESSSTTTGTVIISVDYDAVDAAPLSKVQAMSYRGSVRSAPWTNCVHASSSEDLSKLKSYFVRTGAQPASTDLKTYDVGNCFIISQGINANLANLGEIYVEYEVLLMTPTYVYQPTLVGGQVSGLTTLSLTNPLGVTAAIRDGSVGLAYEYGTPSVVDINSSGAFLVDIYVAGTGLTSIVTPVGSAGVTFVYIEGTGSTTYQFVSFYVSSPAPFAFNFSCTGTGSPTVTACNVMIASWPSGLSPFTLLSDRKRESKIPLPDPDEMVDDCDVPSATAEAPTRSISSILTSVPRPKFPLPRPFAPVPICYRAPSK